MGLRCASILMAVVILIAGCKTSAPTGLVTTSHVTARPYTIGIGDRLRFFAPTILEFHQVEFTLQTDGTVDLPLIGPVFAAGRTPVQLASELTEKMRRYYVDPEIHIQIAQFNSQSWYVESGRVRVAQPYTAQDRAIDALSVIQTDKPTQLQVFRHDENGRLIAINPTGEPLEAGDTVRVRTGSLMSHTSETR